MLTHVETHDQDHETADIDARDHVPQPGGSLTVGTVATVRDELLRSGVLFRVSDEGLARHFADRFLDGNAWKHTLAELRDVVAALDGCPDNVPTQVEDFPRWVRMELLEPKYLPRDKLAELYSWASEDLAAIESHISDCSARMTEIAERDPKTDTDESEIRFFRYYLELNEEAKQEIIDVSTLPPATTGWGAGGWLSEAPS